MMTRSPILLLAILLVCSLSCASGGTATQYCSPSRIVSGASACKGRVSLPAAHRLHELRGGADGALDEEDEDDDDADDAAADELENPCLGVPATGSGGGMGGGPGLDDLASTLQNPAALQEAMKEDPAFQESMKQYMEQITKDPQFEALKKQTE